MKRPIPWWYRWELMVLLWLAYSLHQIDRVIFSVQYNSIKAELNLTDSQMGLCSTLLFLVMAALVPLAGYVGDRYSKKWIITIALIFWSSATALTGTARGIVGLFVFRSFLTAGGEAFYGPASTAMIAAFHKKTRAIALSIHQSAVYFGPMLAANFGVFIGNHLGWRAVFFFFGGIGVLMGILLMFRLREAPVAGDTDIEQSELPPDKEHVQEKIPFWSAVRQIVRIPTVLLLTVGFTAIVFVNNAYLTFAPTYIQERFDVSHSVASIYGMSMHFVAAFIGVIIGGIVADALVTRWKNFRLILQSTVMFLGAPMIFLIGYVSAVEMLWVILFLFGLFRGLYESNTHAAIFDVVPPKLRAMVVGLMILAAMGIGSVSPILFGYLADLNEIRTDGFALAFQLTSLVWLLGGFCVLSALLFTFKKDRLCDS